MSRADWRSPAAYEDLRSLDAPGFAWEFLSRNQAFERDCKRLELAASQGPLSAGELEVSRSAGGCDFVLPEPGVDAERPAVDGGEPAERDPDSSTPAGSRRNFRLMPYPSNPSSPKMDRSG